jgi:hypothetical protein
MEAWRCCQECDQGQKVELESSRKVAQYLETTLEGRTPMTRHPTKTPKDSNSSCFFLTCWKTTEALMVEPWMVMSRSQMDEAGAMCLTTNEALPSDRWMRAVEIIS